MRLAIISDTHLPKGIRRLPDACIERLLAADLIIHAGDFTRMSVLHEIKAYGPVVAVHGNVDDCDVRTALPETNEVQVDGATIAVIHDAGPTPQRLGRLRSRFPHTAAVIFGHTHFPLHEADENGFQIFNPGSPTERRRAPSHTMGLARVDDGALTFELIELD
jgi:putative phosphoesterase